VNEHPSARKSHVLFQFFAIARGFWSGETALRAWGFTCLLVVLLIFQILMQLAMNTWNRVFFDALERKDVSAVWETISVVPLIIIALAAALSFLVVSRLYFQMRWREWLTKHLAGWWIADQRYYRLNFVAPDQSAPEYRIADDVGLSVEPLVEFAVGLLNAIITGATFAAVLWHVAGSAKIPWGNSVIEIPAFMVFAAILYAAFASSVAYLAGSPLVKRFSLKNDVEAQFRVEMTRLRENAESIALIRGDKDELNSVLGSYNAVVSAWLSVIKQQGIVTLVLNTNGSLFPIIPLLLLTPKYLSGDLTLGAVMQLVAAFSAVQGALIWFVDNFMKLAEWYASASRVVELANTLEEIDVGSAMAKEPTITMGHSNDGAIHIEKLCVADRAGTIMINDASLSIAMGEKVILTGESGSGKSILIRALAGLWPWGSGSIRVPDDVKISFVPQRPYLPLGTLRQALLYPEEREIDQESIEAAMRRCGLGYLIKELDKEARWDQTLSGGERQRVAFTRLLIQKPQIIIMDEATSALDEDSQFSLLTLLHHELAPATVISVAHRSGIEEFHSRKIMLEKRVAGAHLTSRKLPHTLWHLLLGRGAT
jgi:vitamin B12/bleomycin/antimicrobial peptide transport system ATP-binding/permease protein